MKTPFIIVAILLLQICFGYSVEIESLHNSLAPPKGKLYGFGDQSGLVLINADTGSQTPVGDTYPQDLASQQLSGIDVKHNIYYIIAQNSSSNVVQLVGLDLKTGDVIVNEPLPFTPLSLVGVGQFVDVEPSTGDVFVTGGVSLTTYKHEMYRYVYQTKQLKLITSFNAINVMSTNSVYDSKNKIEFITYATNQSGVVHVRLEGYDVVTGKLVSKLSLKDGLTTLSFDTKTGLIVGLGGRINANKKYERLIYSLNGATGEYNVVGVLPTNGEVSDLGGLCALDVGRRILYVVMSKGGNSDPFYLVSVNIDTVEQVHQALLCPASLDNCPWSIEFKTIH